MSEDRYPAETLDGEEDDGTIVANLAELGEAVVGHRIVSAERGKYEDTERPWRGETSGLILTLDTGQKVRLANTDDCCAYTELEDFFLDPASVDHAILGVGATEGYTTWHIYADFGDVMRLKVGWSCGNPFYYGYGFHIDVVPA
jgi:hypothetical protein